MANPIHININGKEIPVNASPRDRLLDVLRDLDYLSVKQGCGTGDCGVCTVLLDGKPVRSCMTKVEQAVRACHPTLEGIQQDGELHSLQQAFIETGAINAFLHPGADSDSQSISGPKPQPQR